MREKTCSTLKRNPVLMPLFAGIMLCSGVFAQNWAENTVIFNPSGVPSLPFSQPRFADLDGDGDLDLIIGSISSVPHYMTNIGTSTSPKFMHVENIFENVSSLDAEMAIFYDIDNDGDLDMICGGHNGLNLYRNIGNVYYSVFEKVDNYFSGIDASRYPIPDMADVNNNGKPDLVLGFSEDGTVKVYYNIGSDSVAVFSESNSITLGDVGLYAYPVFCDPDHDGDFDILVGRDGMGLIYYQNIGTPENPNWQQNTSVFAGLATEGYFNSPVLADISGDGKQDLIYGTANGPLTYYRNTGTLSSPTWTKNTSLFGGIIDVGGASTPFFYDFDGDGDLDMISGSQMGDIKYYENVGTAQNPAWKGSHTYFANLKHSIYSSVSLGDINGNGLPDALVGDLSGNIYLHENTGTGFQKASNALIIDNIGGWASPLFIDMDKDGDLDIVAGNEDGDLFYYENQGTPTQPMWTEIRGYFSGINVRSCAVPALADLDFDGDYDLVTGNSWRQIQYFENQSGVWVEDTTMVAGIVGGQNCSPAFADLDGDGDRDLILGNYDGTFAYYENLQPVVAISEKPVLPAVFELNNYPNPFNPFTLISYYVPENGEITLEMYDLSGKHLKVLSEGQRDAGYYRLHLHAEADMASGIYLLHLRSNGNTVASKKITLLK